MIGGLHDSADAQSFVSRKRKYAEVGFSLNATNYFGDITPGPSILSFRPGSTRLSIGLSASKKFGGRTFLRGGVNWARITGSDAKAATPSDQNDYGRWQRNLSFRNDIFEINGVGMLYLFNNYGDVYRRPDINPYVFGGAALFVHSPKAEVQEGDNNGLAPGWYKLRELRTEGQSDEYSKAGIAIPFGLGVTYKLGRMFDLSFEIGWRKTFTDYLDDVSGSYADKGKIEGQTSTTAVILSDRTLEVADQYDIPVFSRTSAVNGKSYEYTLGHGREGQQRGDKFDSDWYIISGFRLSYMLIAKGHAPKFR